MEEAKKLKEDQEIKDHCTFKPRLITQGYNQSGKKDRRRASHHALGSNINHSTHES